MATDADDVHDHDDEYEPSPRRRWRWVVLFFLLLVVGLAGWYLTWTRAAAKKIAAMTDELRRAGEPVAPQDLVHPPVPLEQDAAIDLREAVALLDQTSPAFKAANEIDTGEPLSRAQAETIAKLVEAERDVLDKIRGARGKPDADWKIPYQSPMLMTLLPHLNDQRSLANLKRYAAVHERLAGNDGAALEHLRDVIAIGRATDSNPFMIGHLVSIGINAIATHHLIGMAPDLAIETAGDGKGGGATPDQVRATIRELLDEARSDRALLDAVRGERVMVLDTMKLLAERKLDARTVMGGGTGPNKGIPPIPRGLILADAGIVIGQNTAVLKALEQSPDYPAYLKNAPPPVPAALKQSPKLHFMASMFLPAYDRFVTQHFRAKADRRLAAVALALRLYAVEHGGKYPATLDELVPDYLPAVPTDPFAAGEKPLRYVVDDPEAPVVYSVGENGTDDGGSEGPTNPRRRASPGRWEKKDAVVRITPRPLRMTEEEERKAKEQEEQP